MYRVRVHTTLAGEPFVYSAIDEQTGEILHWDTPTKAIKGVIEALGDLEYHMLEAVEIRYS